ncbi:MAG: peptidoglycan-binding protein, partial [Burkholderiales bacterium]
AISTIDPQAIEPFLNRPLITDAAGIADRPRIMATQEGRVYLGRGDIAYVRGLEDGDRTEDFHVFRSARPILDPETREPIAYEALFVGTARVERRGDPTPIRITSAVEEVGAGDRLLPFDRPEPVQYAPRPPAQPVRGRVVSLYRGVAQAGRFNVVALDVGADKQLEVGHVLAIKQAGRVVVDRGSDKRDDRVRLPDETVGHRLVFRVFDRVSYGLIMASSSAISVGDAVVNP